MRPGQIEEDRLVTIHRLTVPLFVALPATRLLYIAACGTPLRENPGHRSGPRRC
jgi:hypothetical protein